MLVPKQCLEMICGLEEIFVLTFVFNNEVVVCKDL